MENLQFEDRRAFTLVELLVVVAIIIVLLAILQSSLSNVIAQANEAVCASNLRQIGEGMIGYATNEKFYPGSYTRYRAASLNHRNEACAVWPGQVRAYMGGDTDVFYCPEAPPEAMWERQFGSGNPARYGYEAGEYWVAGHATGGTSYGHNNDGTRSHRSRTSRQHGNLGLSDDPDRIDEMVPPSAVQQPAQFICFGDSKLDNVWDAFIDYTVPNEDLATRHRGGAYILLADGHVEWIHSPEYEDNSFCLCIDPEKGRMWNNDFRYP